MHGTKEDRMDFCCFLRTRSKNTTPAHTYTQDEKCTRDASVGRVGALADGRWALGTYVVDALIHGVDHNMTTHLPHRDQRPSYDTSLGRRSATAVELCYGVAYYVRMYLRFSLASC